MIQSITSAQNPKIKALLELQRKSSLRRGKGLFVVEGQRELRQCIDAGFEIDSIFYCPSLLRGRSESGALCRKTVAARGHVNGRGPTARLGGMSAEREVMSWRAPADRSAAEPLLKGIGEEVKIFEVSEDVYAKIAMREGTEGVMAEVKVPQRRLEDLRLPDNPLIMVLESVEKPGNLGAVLRSADAAGADAVLVCDPLTDLWNPNLIRASLGAIFTVPCVGCSSTDAIAFLKARGIRILTAQLQDSSLYYDCDMTAGTALVMGTEATGLTDIWREAADAHILIPMLGRLDSLNVSVSAAILLFEAVRQRHG